MNAADRASKLDLSFSSIYQEHFPMVFRFGFRLLGDSEKAMDLSQEVFLKLYAALDGGPAILEIKSWLFRTAANLCLGTSKKPVGSMESGSSSSPHERPSCRGTSRAPIRPIGSSFMRLKISA
jgi:DNA-directed RNA polymerase specialized sigma24 family protein